MKTIYKRIGAVLMVVVMVVTMMSVGVTAANGTNGTQTTEGVSLLNTAPVSDGPTVWLDTTKITDGTCVNPDVVVDNQLNYITGPLEKGSTFYVPVMLSNMAEFNAFNLRVKYDDTVLKLKEAKAFHTFMFMGVVAYNFAPAAITTVQNNQIMPVGLLEINTDTNVIAWSNSQTVVNDEVKPIVYIGFDVIEKSDTGIEEISIESSNTTAGINNSTAPIEDNDITYVSANVPVESDAPAATTDYEIYYVINGTYTDNDNFVEVAPGASFNVDVCIKSTSNETKKLQAFDIYPTWDPMLTCTEVTSTLKNEAGESKVNVNEMDAAQPHFYSVAKNLDIDVPAEGITLATMVMTLSEDAVHNTGYAVSLGAQTNIAVEKEAESIPVLLDTTVKGAETLKDYDVVYEDGVNEEIITVPNAAKKLHNVNFAPTFDGVGERSGYTFLGWSETKGAQTATYTEDNNAVYAVNAGTTLYAVWSKNTFTLTFDTDDGSAIEPQEYAYGETITPPADPTKEGYNFTGWEPAIPGTMPATDLTVKAQWEIKKYTITWLNWDGTVLETDTVEHGDTPKYDSNPPKKPADAQYTYTFKGWDPAVAAATQDQAYTAQFNEIVNQYKITFSDNGATKESELTDYNDTIKLPAADGKTGYHFIGWHNGTEIVGLAGENYTVTGAVTLTAQYEANTYTVKFNANGGTGSIADQGFTYGVEENLTLNNDQIKNGNNKFAGWNTEADGTGTTYADGATITTNNALTTENGVTVTLYAQWTTAYIVEGESTTNVTVTPNKNFAVAGEQVTVTVVPAEGYQVDKVYYTKADGTEEVLTGTEGEYIFEMPEHDINVQAVTSKITYNVVVDENIEHGTVEADLENATIGDKVTLTATPDTGYKLTGYTVTGTDVTVEVGADGKFEMPASNVTVTAAFEEITYTITFDKNGGDGTMNSITGVKYTQSVTLTRNVFTKTGYSFRGWALSATGDVAHIDEKIVSKLSATDGAIVTLFAVWDANEYTVILDHNYTGSENGTLTVTYDGKYAGLADAVRKGYEFLGWSTSKTELTNETKVTAATDVKTADNHTLYAHWNAMKFNVTLVPGEDVTMPKDAETEFEFTYDSTYEGFAEPSKNGYTFDVWVDEDGNEYENGEKVEITDDVTLTPKWTLVEYKITFELDDGTLVLGDITLDADGKMIYTIESELILPTATKEKFVFGGWVVKETVGTWTEGSLVTVDPEQKILKAYGDVTLTAKWNAPFTYEVEEYKYAPENYVMLRIAAADNTDAYKFGEQAMYYTTDGTYRVKTDDQGTMSAGAYVTLIPMTNNVNDDLTLTDDAIEALSKTGAAAATIARNGKVNMNDEIVNIADANAVYQMIQAGGSYYSVDQLDVPHRLVADMDPTIDETDNEYRASILDVHEIVTRINANANIANS